ncbi:MAG: carbohydrate ABC transporter permease [Anaerolineaceae bacterium]|jgi:alpha-glucoside transport system permease protein|nr:carbohydrate ABC transporter permease [Anaerolineaceae bacterium]MDD4042513.1 carbohydrate ABC transporter permease [Anaerolineaceae bacterium]MDD4578509.1 carbohydrate ABC transporter permease [Anaerolineaceae bacterium]
MTTATLSKPLPKQRLKRKPNNIGTGIGIVIILILWLVPTIGLLVTSFRPVALINTTGWWTALDVNNGPISAQHPDPNASYAEKLGTRFTINNYVDALTGYRGTSTYLDACASTTKPLGMNCDISDLLNPRGMGRAFVNSIIVTVPSTIFPILIALFAAYAFAWMDFKGRYAIFAILVGLQVVPIQMTLVPVLRMFAGMGMNGTFPAVWLFHTGFGLPYAIYMLRNSMSTLPKDLFESAYLDGANHWQVFTKIVLPLTMPAIASLAIFQFLWVWNDLLVSLVFLGGSKPVMTYQISNMVSSLGAGWHLLTAAAFLSMLLPMIVFFALQKYFVRGMMAGAVKG